MLKDIFIKKENQLMLVLIFFSVLLIVIGFYLLSKKEGEDVKPRKIPNSIEETVWKDFESKKYNFSLEYPEHFLLFEDDKEFGPVFNFYFEVKDSDLPLSHLVEESHFSVYPTGVPVGGELSFLYSTSEYKNKNGVLFILKEFKTYSGKTWAIMATPKNPPKNWKQWGFVWISAKIKNPSIKCFDGKIEISAESCNPFEGDQFYKEGEVDDDIIKIGREFLDKIKF